MFFEVSKQRKMALQESEPHRHTAYQFFLEEKETFLIFSLRELVLVRSGPGHKIRGIKLFVLTRPFQRYMTRATSDMGSELGRGQVRPRTQGPCVWGIKTRSSMS